MGTLRVGREDIDDRGMLRVGREDIDERGMLRVGREDIDSVVIHRQDKTINR